MPKGYLSNRQQNLKIGITSYTENSTVLDVTGNSNFSGIGTFQSDLYVGGGIVGDSIVGTALSISGISTLGTVQISSGIVTATTGIITYYGDGQYLQNIISSGGIGSLTSLKVTGVSTLGVVEINSGIITATSGIVTYYGDGQYLDNVVSGVGIQSGGTVIGTGITTLNFIGAGSTFAVNGNTVDISISAGTTRTVSTYTATSGQTTFSATYNVGYVDVFLNGAKLSENEYTATNGTSIVLDTGASLNDIVEVVGYSNINISGAGGSATPDISPVMMGMIF